MKSTLSILDEQQQSSLSAINTPKLTPIDRGDVDEGDGVVKAEAFAGRAAIVTLGCAKNHVDSEVMLGVLRKSGFEIVSQIELADVAIINTCGFLESAVKESIDSVLDVAQYKTTGQLRSLIVAGCAVERYREELQKALPEVDKFITLEDLLKVGDVAKGKLNQEELAVLLNRSGRPYFLYDERSPRIITGSKHSAYLKISEGCNRPCTFCVIPKIRGEMRSRTITSILHEVENLAKQGVREINLVAQDSTSFGLDRGERELTKLLKALNEQGAVDWIRLLYAYPVGVDEELLETISSLPRVVEYLDIPLQHVSDQLLKGMKRPLGKLSPRSIVKKIKDCAPNLKIRSTFIVGFPGETSQHVTELEEFVAEGWFTSLGVFTYSPEVGTPAYEMDNQVTGRELNSRRARIMKKQQGVALKNNRQLLGQKLEVMIDGAHQESDLLIAARARFQAPEVDGGVIINDLGDEIDKNHAPAKGSIVEVEVNEIAGYDLVAKLSDYS